jgi:hypothetical protein
MISIPPATDFPFAAPMKSSSGTCSRESLSSGRRQAGARPTAQR